LEIPEVKRRSSALSFKNLHKKTSEKSNKEKQIDTSKLPKEEFSFADFFVYWKKYIDILNKQGDKMLVSILNSSEPVLKDVVVELTYPNKMMLEEVKKHQTYILNYLRDKLQNYDLSLQLILNESDEKKYAYTPQEKYARLREINPLIDELRKKLHLDL
jgi:DNA polymerase-3 subunit gamma/tau